VLLCVVIFRLSRCPTTFRLDDSERMKVLNRAFSTFSTMEQVLMTMVTLVVFIFGSISLALQQLDAQGRLPLEVNTTSSFSSYSGVTNRNDELQIAITGNTTGPAPQVNDTLIGAATPTSANSTIQIDDNKTGEAEPLGGIK
jgi:cell division protein FtsL